MVLFFLKLPFSFPFIKISQQQNSTKKRRARHPHQRAAHKRERNNFLHSLRSSSKDHRPPSPFLQERVEKIPRSPNHLAATLFQSSIAPRSQSYQILVGQDRNGPQEKNLFLFVPEESKTFNQPLEHISYSKLHVKVQKPKEAAGKYLE